MKDTPVLGGYTAWRANTSSINQIIGECRVVVVCVGKDGLTSAQTSTINAIITRFGTQRVREVFHAILYGADDSVLSSLSGRIFDLREESELQNLGYQLEVLKSVDSA